MVRLSAAPIASVLCLLNVAGVCAARVNHSAPTTSASNFAAEDRPAISELSLDGVWTDHVIVQLRVGATAAQLHEVLAATELASAFSTTRCPTVRAMIDPPPADPVRAAKFGLDRFYIVGVAPGSDTRGLAAAIGALKDLVEVAHVDPVGLLHSVPNDPLFGSQWSLNNEGQSIEGTPGVADADIDWIEAWQVPHPSAPVVIGVIDTGLSVSHPDLAGQSVPGRCFICPAGSEGNTDDGSVLSHGTQCSGIAVARTSNGAGVSGTAFTSKVMPLKIANHLAVSFTGTVNAVIWGVDHGASILSMSWGFGRQTNDALLRSSVAYAVDAGVLLIASTGNTPNSQGGQIGYPALYPEVMAVGATTNRDELWIGTTTGPEMDLVAPGASIYTTVDQSGGLANTYFYATGTSMACPMVAAVAAIVWGANPGLTAADVRYLVESSAEDLGMPGRDSTFGMGRLNASRALSASLATLPPCRVDINADGTADVGDLFSFLAIYFTEYGQTGTGLRGDFDESGVVSVDDLFSFMAAWFVGC